MYIYSHYYIYMLIALGFVVTFLIVKSFIWSFFLHIFTIHTFIILGFVVTFSLLLILLSIPSFIPLSKIPTFFLLLSPFPHFEYSTFFSFSSVNCCFPFYIFKVFSFYYAHPIHGVVRTVDAMAGSWILLYFCTVFTAIHWSWVQAQHLHILYKRCYWTIPIAQVRNSNKAVLYTTYVCSKVSEYLGKKNRRDKTSILGWGNDLVDKKEYLLHKHTDLTSDLRHLHKSYR